MKKQIFAAVASLAVVAAMSVSAFAVSAGSSNGSAEVTVQENGSVEFVSDTVEGLAIKADAGVFKAGTKVESTVAYVKEDQVIKVEESVTAALASGNIATSSGEKVTSFKVESVDAVVEVSALLDGAEVQPDGAVKITVARDPKQDSNKVIYIDDKGNVEVLPTDVKDTTITFTTTHFSDFYLVTIDEDEIPNTGVILAVFPAAIAAAAIVISKKRK